MKVLFLSPSLGYDGAVRQMTLLAGGLPRERFEPCVCALGREGPLAAPLRKAGVRTVALDWHRGFDPGPIWRLFRLVREFQPIIIHSWRPLGLRVAALLLGRGRRLFVSAPLPRSETRGRIAGLDRWLLRRAERVVAFAPREGEACRRAGVAEGKIAVVSPAVAPHTSAPTDLPLPPGARCIACVGPLEPAKGFRDAVWAFDILRQVVPAAHLLLIGDGADRPRLQQFVHDSQTEGLAHMLGPRDDVPALLARAEVAWVPGHTGGVNAALEAQAAGLPVIAAQRPELAEVVADGETGFLVPPGDKPALVRRTRLLLEDAARRGQMGAAGRRRAQEHFPVGALVSRCATLYDGPGDPP